MVASHKSGILRTTVIFYALFTFAAMACAGTYSGGSGTAADPYRISTVADWQELIATSADLYRSFVLVNDIDFGGMNLTPVAPDFSANNGFQGAPFDGVFEGNGHILGNAAINLPDNDYVGLFGYLGANGKIRNLGVENIAVNGRQYVGGLAGYLYSGTITASYATGSVVGSSWSVGGLVGLNEYGEITASYATGSVAGIRAGGLVGTDYGAINRVLFDGFCQRYGGRRAGGGRGEQWECCVQILFLGSSDQRPGRQCRGEQRAFDFANEDPCDISECRLGGIWMGDRRWVGLSPIGVAEYIRNSHSPGRRDSPWR